MASVYIAIGPNCWGRGRDTLEAVKEARRSWPKHYKNPRFGAINQPSLKHFTVYIAADPWAHVNGLGQVVTAKGGQATRIRQSILAEEAAGEVVPTLHQFGTAWMHAKQRNGIVGLSALLDNRNRDPGDEAAPTQPPLKGP